MSFIRDKNRWENNTEQHHIVIKQEKKGAIYIALAVELLRLWYRTLTGAPMDINKKLHFPLFIFVPCKRNSKVYEMYTISINHLIITGFSHKFKALPNF